MTLLLNLISFDFMKMKIKNIINQIKKPFVFFDIGANQGLL